MTRIRLSTAKVGKILNDAGITVRDFPRDLRDEIALDNATFLTRYKMTSGDFGQISVDHRLNGGKHAVMTSIGQFVIQPISPTLRIPVWYFSKSNTAGSSIWETPWRGKLEPRWSDNPRGDKQSRPCLRSANGYLLVKRITVEPEGPGQFNFEYEARGSLE
jgi:hypothetical protein